MDESLNLGKAEDERLHNLLHSVEGEISDYAKTIAEQVNRLAQIGIALSAEHDINKLLEMIVDGARHFTNADAGTLYMMENEKLVFRILQNETLKIRKGGTGDKVELPPVPLLKTNVSAYVALTRESVNSSRSHLSSQTRLRVSVAPSSTTFSGHNLMLEVSRAFRPIQQASKGAQWV